MTIDQKKLALIHIIKKELNLSEEDYRTILRNVAKVSSAAKLDDRSFRKLINYLVRDKRYLVSPGGMTLKQKLFIQHLSNQLHWHPEHLINFIKKYYHKPALEELDRKEASKLIESLKHIDLQSKENT